MEAGYGRGEGGLDEVRGGGYAEGSRAMEALMIWEVAYALA